MKLKYIIKTSFWGIHNFKLCFNVARGHFLFRMFFFGGGGCIKLFDRGIPFTAVLREIHNLDLEQNNLLLLVGLRKDIKVRNSPKITPTFVFSSDKSLFDHLV